MSSSEGFNGGNYAPYQSNPENQSSYAVLYGSHFQPIETMSIQQQGGPRPNMPPVGGGTMRGGPVASISPQPTQNMMPRPPVPQHNAVGNFRPISGHVGSPPPNPTSSPPNSQPAPNMIASNYRGGQVQFAPPGYQQSPPRYHGMYYQQQPDYWGQGDYGLPSTSGGGYPNPAFYPAAHQSMFHSHGYGMTPPHPQMMPPQSYQRLPSSNIQEHPEHPQQQQQQQQQQQSSQPQPQQQQHPPPSSPNYYDHYRSSPVPYQTPPMGMYSPYNSNGTPGTYSYGNIGNAVNGSYQANNYVEQWLQNNPDRTNQSQTSLVASQTDNMSTTGPAVNRVLHPCSGGESSATTTDATRDFNSQGKKPDAAKTSKPSPYMPVVTSVTPASPLNFLDTPSTSAASENNPSGTTSATDDQQQQQPFGEAGALTMLAYRDNFTDEQTAALTAAYNINPTPSMDAKKEICSKIGITLAQANRWFTGKRAEEKPADKRRYSSQMSQEQIDILNEAYDRNKMPSGAEKQELASKLGITLYKVNAWYNRRFKRETAEMEAAALSQ